MFRSKRFSLKGVEKMFWKKALFLFLFFLTAISFAFATDSTNFLVNPGAEYNILGDNVPDFWRLNNPIGKASCEIDTTEAYSGSASAKLKTESETVTVRFMIPIFLADPMNKEIKIGLHYKTAGFSPSASDKIYINIGGSVPGVGTYDLKKFYLDPNAPNWKSYESETYKISHASRVYSNLVVSVFIKDAIGTLWVDDLWLKVIDVEDDGSEPNEPINLLASRIGLNTVSLTWEPPNVEQESDLPIMYKIYRDTNRGFTPSIDNLITEVPGSETEVSDNSVEDGVRYYYVVASVDKMGNLKYSREVVASDGFSYSGNLIENGSFEQISGSPPEPEHWTFNTPNREGSASIDSTIFRDGKYSLRIENLADTEYNRATQHVLVEENTDYVIGYWIKGDKIEKGSGGQGARVYCPGAVIPSRTGTFDWEYISVPFNSGDKTKLEIVCYLHQSTGTVWFDKVGIYLAETLDGTPPEIPVDFKALPVPKSNKVELSWKTPDEAPDGDLPSAYRIYRAEGSEEAILLDEISGLNWTDETASANELRYFVIAIDKAGIESDPSEIVTIGRRFEIKGRVVRAGNEGEEDTVPLEGVTVSIEGIGLSMTTQADGNFSFKWVLEGEYQVILEKKKYKKKPVKATLLNEDLDLEDQELEGDDIPPNEPTDLQADADSHVGLIFLTWTEPSPAKDEEIADFYNIYRSQTESFHRVSSEIIGTSKITSFYDFIEEENFGKTFYYWVEAVDSAENPSKATTEVAFATVKTPAIPVAVGPNNRELFIDKAPTFEWEIEEDSDLSGFIIQVSKEATFAESKTFTQETNNLNLSYTWPELLSESVWYWRLKAKFKSVDNKVVKSGWSTTNEFVSLSTTNTQNLVPFINVVPNVFRDQNVRISYLLTEEATVEIKIFNLGGKLVDVLLPPLRQGAQYYDDLIWKGKDSKGKELLNGLYLIQIVADNGRDKREKLVKKIVVFR